MPDQNSTTKDFSKYRGYLKFLARRHLSAQYLGRLDYSDVVQQTLLNAYAAKSQFQGESEPEKLAWLRQILVNCISHLTRGFHAKKRDVQREKSLAADLDASSMRLENFMAGKESSPSQCMDRKDRVLFIANAIESLPEEQRQVVILRYWEDKSIREVAEQLEKSIPAVAGLLHRATKKLRTLLKDERP
jgi:RNA polymerase sigma-70 factor (ECF subfamily)